MKKHAAHNRKSYLKQKLISATAMLVVSATVMVSTSYAWYVMSTAPEVTNIKTQVGANGALEIALLNSESWENLALLDTGDIDESATASILDANLTWGNLINLGDASYGMDKIVLNPSRLYLEQDGSQYKVNTVMLKTPIYGEDGRVQGLDKTSAVAYICENGQFSRDGHGVRAIGTSATMSAFQLGMNAARSAIVTNAAAARTAASNSLNQTGGDLANIVVQYALNKKTEGYTVADVQAIRTLAVGLQTSLDSIETALRYAFAGYITTENSGVATDAYTAALEEILNPDTTLASLQTKYSGITTTIQSIGTYISTLNTDQTTVGNAISNCDTKIATGGTFTWAQISQIVYPLVDTDKMTIGGKSITEVQNSVKNPDGSINFGEVFNLVQGGINISVPTGSGILSDISDYAGNYSAKVTVKDFKYGEYGPMDVDANMTTATTVNPVYLTACSNALRASNVSADTGSNSITDYYGYAIDLAFRTNAVSSDLLLQTEPENRVYEGDNQNAALQGGGSYMSFTTGAGLSATKMVKLMRGIRVVLMDEGQNVLAMAALDCTLGQNVYTVLSDEEKAATGMWAYLDGSASTYQKSDLITAAEYNALPTESHVTFDKTTGKVTAKLYLYAFELAKNTNGDYTGATTLGAKKDSAAITPLEQDVVQQVTAVVYLDGSVVNNSMVAADSAQSMTGTLNLQFSSSATLIPAENTKLRAGDSAEGNAGGGESDIDSGNAGSAENGGETGS